MTMKEVEEKVIELIYREPFDPFTVETTDGRRIKVPHPRLAITSDGAGFIDPEEGIVDIDFRQVCAIHMDRLGAVA